MLREASMFWNVLFKHPCDTIWGLWCAPIFLPSITSLSQAATQWCFCALQR